MTVGEQGAVVVTPDQIVNGSDGIYRPGMSTGSATVLPMTEEEIAAVKEREKTKKIGFQS